MAVGKIIRKVVSALVKKAVKETPKKRARIRTRPKPKKRPPAAPPKAKPSKAKVYKAEFADEVQPPAAEGPTSTGRTAREVDKYVAGKVSNPFAPKVSSPPKPKPRSPGVKYTKRDIQRALRGKKRLAEIGKEKRAQDTLETWKRGFKPKGTRPEPKAPPKKRPGVWKDAKGESLAEKAWKKDYVAKEIKERKARDAGVKKGLDEQSRRKRWSVDDSGKLVRKGPPRKDWNPADDIGKPPKKRASKAAIAVAAAGAGKGLIQLAGKDRKKERKDSPQRRILTTEERTKSAAWRRKNRANLARLSREQGPGRGTRRPPSSLRMKPPVRRRTGPHPPGGRRGGR